MNTRKQVLLMSALLLISLIVVGIYAAWYPSRATDAETEFEELSAMRGSTIFAANCRLCHGDVGEGGALGARLPAAPALDRPGLQGFVDIQATLSSNINAEVTSIQVSNAARLKKDAVILIDSEWMKVKRVNGNQLNVQRGINHTEAASHTSGATVQLRDPDALDDMMTLVTNTITCGRVGTPMQPWAQTQGGTLSAEQIRQLTLMINEGRFDLVKEQVDHADETPATLTQAVDADTRNLRVSDVSIFNQGEAIRISDERMRITGVTRLPRDAAGNLPKDRSGIIEVTRGALGTTPLEHAAGEHVFRFPDAPTEPAINQSSCGQTARASAPPAPPGLIEPFTGQTVNVVAQNITFDVREIRVNTGGQMRVRLDNRDSGVQHNIAFYTNNSATTPISADSIGTTFAGPEVDDTVFNVPAAGNYYFRCDVHPTTMFGTFVVQ